jgi:CheY-like chemotaxis protein
MEERGKIAFGKIKIQCPDLIILDIQLPEEWD